LYRPFIGPPAPISGLRAVVVFDPHLEGAMTRHPTARRVHHNADASPDVVAERFFALLAWARRNARTLIVTTAVVVGGSVAAIVYGNAQRVARAQAAARLNEVRATAASGNYALAIRDLEAFLQRFARTDAAQEARVLLAQLHLDAGEAAKAIEILAPLAGKADQSVGASAGILLGIAYQQSGDAQKAEATFLRVGERGAMDFQRREALEHAARLRLEQGQAARAADLYQRLRDQAPVGSPERAIYDLRLAEVRARAQ
jgi:predicted negative regulator of RcsB-dependent stress response